MTKRAINLAEFNELSKALQLEVLHRDGAHVGKQIIDGNNVILFQLYGFYVEVHYEEYRKKVNYLITSDNADILQPYLSQIHIKELDKEIGEE